MLKPDSSFTTQINKAKLPALLIYLHQDFLASDGLSLTCPVSGIKLNFSQKILKDAAGMYASSSTTVSSVEGTMPTLTTNDEGLIVALCIAKPSSGIVGLNAIFGVVSGAGFGLSTAGVIWQDSAKNTVPTAPALISASNSCQLAAFNTTLPGADATKVRRLGADNFLVPPGNAAADITTAGQIQLAQLAAAITLNAFTAGAPTARLKCAALLNFAVGTGAEAVDATELRVACSRMADTGNIYAPWMNKPAG